MCFGSSCLFACFLLFPASPFLSKQHIPHTAGFSWWCVDSCLGGELYNIVAQLLIGDLAALKSATVYLLSWYMYLNVTNPSVHVNLCSVFPFVTG